MANMRVIMPALQRAKTSSPTPAAIRYRSASPPKQQRQTRIVKNLSADEIAREIVAWIEKA